MKNNITHQPKISIVTPSYNQGQYIEETIQSVLQQNYPNLEYIIIDGGSTDNSVEIIKKYEKYLTFWVSEKDKGQVDAINKGLKYCTGSIFNWLNSDDYLTTGALDIIASTFTESEADAIAGKVNNFSANSTDIVQNKNLSSAGLMRWDKGVQFVQPGVWLKRDLLAKSGGIDERFHFAFDWDMLIRYLYFFPKVSYTDKVLVNFRLHDESKTVSVHNKFLIEEREIIEKLYKVESLKELHPACKWKIDRTKWTAFLIDITSNKDKSTTEKIMTIVKSIGQQPFDVKVFRMTMGAVKQILFH